MKSIIQALTLLSLLLTTLSSLYCAPTQILFAFDSKDDLRSWIATNFEQVGVQGGALVGRTRYDCMLTSPVLNIAAQDYPELIFRARSTLSGGGEVFFCHPGEAMSDKRQLNHNLIGDGAFHIYRVDLSSHPEWTGTISRIRLDLLNAAGADVALDFVALRGIPGQMLYNGSAEMLEGNVPLQWTPIGTGAMVTMDSPFEGSRALRLECRSAGDAAWVPERVDLSFLGRFKVSGCARGVAPRVKIEFTTINDKPLKGESFTRDLPAPGNSWQPFRIEFTAPRLAAWAKVSFTTATTGRLDLDDVNIRQLEKGAILGETGTMPSWNAAWIWHPHTLNDDNTTAYFRKTFTVPATARVTIARVQITADDHFRLFINGAEVAHTFGIIDAWRTPRVLDIKPYLKDGENLLTIEARDDGSAQGLLAEVALVLGNETVTEIQTGDDWETTISSQEGWKTDPRAPGDWIPAKIIARAPGGVWGALPYEFLGGGACLDVEKFTAAYREKERVHITLRVKPVTTVQREVRGEVTFSRDGKVCGRRWVNTFRIPAGANVGAPVTWSAEVPLTYGLRSGMVDVSVSLFGGHWKHAAPKASVNIIAPEMPRSLATAKVVPGPSGPVLLVNGKPTNPTQAWFLTADAMHARNASLAGVKIWSVECDDLGWKGAGKYDYSAIDTRLQTLLDVDPNVWLILTYDLSTRWQPWWINAHPEAWCRMEGPDETIGDYAGSRRRVPSFASPTWREAFLDAQTRFIRHVKQSPFASRVIGFQPCNGITYEWFLWGAQSNELVDYSEAGVADFRRWLREKYKTDAALQAAWRNLNVTLATAQIPTDVQRRSPAAGSYFIPGTQQAVIDYNRHQHDQVVDTILYFARGVKKATEGKSLVGTFYGYVSYIPESSGFCQSSGHFALSRMLQQPEIDFLMAPTAYSWRELGNASGCMTAFGSLVLNSKIWWNQADTRTHWSHQAGYGRPPDLTGSIQLQRREEVLALTTGCAVQWYDFSAGWMWGDQRLAEEARNLKQIDIACRNRKPLPRKDVLAVVIDDEQMGRADIFQPAYGAHLIYRQCNFLHKSGVPWTMYLFSDLVHHPELKEHRAFLFLNLFYLDSTKRKVIEELKCGGRVLTFVGPAGYIDDDFSVDRASRVVGIKVTQLDATAAPPLTCRVLRPRRPQSGFLSHSLHYGVGLKPNPAFMIDDPEAENIGKFDCTDITALALRRHEGWTSVLSLAPGLPSELIRDIAREARLHVYTDSDDPTFIGYGLVGVHAATSGEKVIHLPASCTVKEWFSGTTTRGKVREIRRKMETGETLLFQLD